MPASRYFAGDWHGPGEAPAAEVLVYGEAHLLRAAFLKGANDYLREPWTVEELVMRAGFRRPRIWLWRSLGVAFQLEGTTLRGLQRVELTSAEAILLGALVQRQGKFLSAALLAHALYGEKQKPTSRVVATLVSRLRTRLRRAGIEEENPIAMRRAEGYRLP